MNQQLSELEELLTEKNTPKALCIQLLWDILSDLKFFNFSSLLNIANKRLHDEPVTKLLILMSKSGYNEFSKDPISIPPVKSLQITQKLLILDLIDACAGKSFMDFETLLRITNLKSVTDLMEFLILVLTTGVLQGKINMQKKILIVYSVISRNYDSIHESSLLKYNERISNSILLLTNQHAIIQEKVEKWKQEEQEYQDLLKKVSDTRQFKKSSA